MQIYETVQQIFPNCQVEQVLKFNYKHATIKIIRKEDNLPYLLKMHFFQTGNTPKRTSVMKIVRIFKQVSVNETQQFIKLFELSFDVSYSYFGLIEELKTETLKHIIKEKKTSVTPFDESEIISYIQNIALAVQEWQTLGIPHLRLKPSSIYISETGQLQIGECDLVYFLTNTISYENMFYQSYQTLKGKPTMKCDIWSIGCILYELMTFKAPYNARDIESYLKMYTQELAEPMRIKDVSIEYSKKLNQLCVSMLALEESLRPSIKQILAFIATSDVKKLAPSQFPIEDSYALAFCNYFGEIKQMFPIPKVNPYQYMSTTFFRPGQIKPKRLPLMDKQILAPPRPLKNIYNDPNMVTQDEYKVHPFVSEMPKLTVSNTKQHYLHTQRQQSPNVKNNIKLLPTSESLEKIYPKNKIITEISTNESIKSSVECSSISSQQLGRYPFAKTLSQNQLLKSKYCVNNLKQLRSVKELHKMNENKPIRKLFLHQIIREFNEWSNVKQQ